MIKIAVAQLESATDKQENLKKALGLIESARSRKADVVAFPEFLMAFSPADESAAELACRAESLGGPFVSALKEAAKISRVAIIATIYESCPVPERVYDSALWIDNGGELAAVYRKLHLYDAFGFKESAKFHPGGDIAEPVACADARCGMMICYDLRFPEMARMLSLRGSHVLFAPSGWVQGDMKLDHWQTMIKARALENGCYLVAPGQTGNIYIGHSLVADPYGRIFADMGEAEGLEVVDLDLDVVTEAREKLPLLKNRRAEVYARHLVSR
ncbi:MAG TPA: carbon-nitrogen hydrolase family protein [Candidatus Binatia bacterium]|nr:carbon-nitrogen hydrolase family protein [Candidatus Binatia bacterium]